MCIRDRPSALLNKITTHLHSALARLATMNKPVVIAINGPAAGAGIGLATVGDLVLASSAAHFTMAYTAVGLTPDGGTTFLLPRLIGLRRTQELALTNRRVSAEEAAAIGLVTRVVDASEVATEALRCAQDLAQGPTQAFGAVKLLLASCFDTSFETQMQREASTIAVVAQGADSQRGIRAFLGKEKPAYDGLT